MGKRSTWRSRNLEKMETLSEREINRRNFSRKLELVNMAATENRSKTHDSFKLYESNSHNIFHSTPVVVSQLFET